MHEISQGTHVATRSRVVASAIEWPTMSLIGANYAFWLVAGVFYAVAPFVSVVVMITTIVLHSSLQHEAIHRHPTRSCLWNEILVSLPVGLLVPYRRYRLLHLLHHADSRLTDPYDDPESFYVARRDWLMLPRVVQMLLVWNNRLLVRLAIGPALRAIFFLSTEIKALAGEGGCVDRRRDRIAWMLHGVGVAAVLLIVHFLFAMPLGIYLLSAYLALSILAVRSFCEHQWAELPARRTVIVDSSRLGLLFLNNNLHLVHHTYPHLAWYMLPSRYREHREEWRRLNDGYVFRGYGAVLRRFAFRAKEPVPHPAV